jgi:diguanylate cyclase (GGDEF)-like protein/PAS domain S-box-containing protein
MWHALIANFAVVGLFVFGWLQSQELLGRVTRPFRRAALGLFMGGAAVSSMLLSVELEPGIFFDLRSSSVALSGFLGGPIAAVITALIAGSYRLALGGVGAISGVTSIAVVAVISTMVHIWLGHRTAHLGEIAVFSLVTAVVPLGGFLLLPDPVRSSALDQVGPMIVLGFAATLAAAYSIAKNRIQVEERKLLLAAIGQAPDFLYVKDRQSRFVAANQKVATYNGFASPAEIHGKTDFDIAPPERANILFAAEQELITSGGAMLDHEELIYSDNGPQWFLTSKIAVRNVDGEVLGLAGVSRNITERKAMEQALVEGRNQLNVVLTQMSDGLAHFDADGVLKFCNEQYQDMFPLTGHMRVPGAKLVDVLRAAAGSEEQMHISMERRDAWVAGVMASLRTGGEEEVPLFDGRWLHIRTRPMSGGGATVVVSDITNMKQSESGLRELTEQLRTMATVDALTGLVNRGGFDEAMHKEVARGTRNKLPLSLVMIDIDRFKTYNDRYGHQAGDVCLANVAKVLRRAAKRTADVAARYGGEEMCLILPETDHDGAYELAERIRLAVRELNIAHAGSEKGIVTISLGVATLVPGETAGSVLELIRRADAALYIAKDAGRDRVMGWGERHAARA